MARLRVTLLVKRDEAGSISVAILFKPSRRRRHRPPPRGPRRGRSKITRNTQFEARAILEALSSCECTFSWLGDDLDWIPRPTLSYRLSQLRQEGLIASRDDMDQRLYELTPKGREAIGSEMDTDP